MRTQLCSAFALAATLLAVTPAGADELVLETAISTAYYDDTSFDAVSDTNAYSEWNLGATWGFEQLAGLELGLLFQAQPGRLENSRFGGDLYMQWGRQRVLGTVGWGYDIWWFRPNVNAGVGYAHQFLSLESTGPRLKDHAHDLAAQGALGLDFNVPARWGAVGFTSAVGYQLQTAANFDELRHDRKAFEAEYAPDEDPWDRARANFGTMRTNGIFWSIGANVTFEL